MNKTGIKLIFYSLLVCFTTACYSKPVQEARVSSIKPTQPLTNNVSESLVHFDSFYKLTDQADLVITTQAIEAKETLNAARVPGEPAKPDPEFFGIGQMYTIQVDEYFKGDGPKLIHVIMVRGLIPTKDGQEPTTEEIDNAQKSSGVAPLDQSKKYLMFLDRSAHIYPGYEDSDVYVGIAHPWLFDLSDLNCIHPQDPHEFQGNFLPQPYSIIETQINAALAGAVEPQNTAYPGPEIPNQCISDTGKPYP